MGITIKGISYSHPTKKVECSYVKNHFAKYDKNVDEILRILGKKDRHRGNYDKETSLSLATRAVKKLLKDLNLTGQDIDMLMFSSDTPEYLSPTNSIMLHRSIKGKSNMVVYDMNANCAGMTVAFEQMNLYMRTNPKIKRAILVGSQQLSKHAKKTDVVPYVAFGDAAVAVLLEKTEDDAGLIDSNHYVDTATADTIVMPEKGFSNTTFNGFWKRDMHWSFPGNAYANAPKAIKQMSEDNNISLRDIKKYYLSQFVKRDIDMVCSELNEDLNKFTYIGDTFGYTGTTSPFLALAKDFANKTVKKGDTIVLWTVGAGLNTCGVLFKL